MLIQATDDEVIEMGKLAILASDPMGVGYLHHRPGMTKDDIADLEIRGNALHIDYYQGRMVKFGARKTPDGWEFMDSISSEYESWIRDYADYRALHDAAASALAGAAK